MAVITQHTQRFVKFVNQQLDVLKEERRNLEGTADDFIHQVQKEAAAWVNEGQANHSTFEEITSRIQQAITFLITKSVELSAISVREETSQIMPNRMVKIEEDFASLQTKTENIREHQEQVDRKLNEMATQQEQNSKKFENLNDESKELKEANLEKIIDLEKEIYNINSRVSTLFENVTNLNGTLNEIEEENKSVNVSMNELNKQISSVRTCNNDALMSIQDLSKSVESTNQHYNEMSHKMDQLEISINLMSSQCTEQIENVCNLNKDKVNDLFGTVCQLLAKRLTPLEELRAQLNTNLHTRKDVKQKVDIMESQVETMKNQIDVTRSRTDNLETQIDVINDCVDNTNGQVATTGSQVVNMKVEMDTMKKQIQNLKSKIYTCEVQVGSIESQAENIKSCDDSAESQGDSIEASNVREGDQLVSPFNTIRCKVGSLESMVYTLENQMNAMMSQREAMEIQIAAIKSQEETMLHIGNMISRLANTMKRQRDAINNIEGYMERQIDEIKSKEYEMEKEIHEIRSQEDAMGSDIEWLGCQASTMNSHMETAKSQINKIRKEFTQIEIKCNRPNVGFFALKTLNLSAGCDDVTMFDVVDNFGSIFDLSTGQFTAPLNGFYLISISASCQSNASFSLRCFQKTNERLCREYDHRYLCAVYENRSITRCIELMEGEVIYLKSVSSDATQNKLIVIQFSCCMIKG